MVNAKFSPSLMTMDLDKFKDQITFLNKHVDSYHIDIMDGHFVPNITLSPWFIEQVKKISSVPISTHLMVTNPTQWIDQLIKIGSDYICVHAEVMNGIAYRLINQVHNANLKFGVVLNPETKIDAITPYIDLVDKITIMTVDPGFAGEKFIDNTLEKIRELRVLRDINNFGYLIEMDGSSNKNTFEKIQKAGPDIYILGRSGLFGLNESIEESWYEMLEDFNKAKQQIF
ncbi:D-allulose 6-phosphate 3-epimerase [Staphylococcus xylosus]|uniref:Ribulose-phosphate 3-epimerase n=1 Tax=Staphylococcus xylosus TaxID=1288 RepID=A0AAQ0LY04_STAXY|nr:D-allulose 6-phosphate 3-epimerase [Staphylococcus xylosus]MCA2499044.1 ribulose-phosphate 3-epimerase [Staphylococcus xylosus]MCA2503616.1 ribulose-phosphate 3-epimerase [Staphylococcus xylosus]MCE7781390.1 ribulose-phosphate 3-epimerase [Staphylococcus xylosus]OEK85795.1 allulose-6-phosphate 3-epimerase [Staphylococcus xylosus]RIM66607.1 ribulose-phosphate 3-epimerase [Staphylococcus xylosus]